MSLEKLKFYQNLINLAVEQKTNLEKAENMQDESVQMEEEKQVQENDRKRKTEFTDAQVGNDVRDKETTSRQHHQQQPMELQGEKKEIQPYHQNENPHPRVEDHSQEDQTTKKRKKKSKKLPKEQEKEIPTTNDRKKNTNPHVEDQSQEKQTTKKGKNKTKKRKERKHNKEQTTQKNQEKEANPAIEPLIQKTVDNLLENINADSNQNKMYIRYEQGDPLMSPRPCFVMEEGQEYMYVPIGTLRKDLHHLFLSRNYPIHVEEAVWNTLQTSDEGKTTMHSLKKPSLYMCF